MAARLEPLESRDTVQVLFLPRNRIDALRNEAFARGYDQARAEARQREQAEDARRSAALVQAISDMSFGHREARAEVLRSLRPLLEAMTRAVLPELAHASLPDLVAERLTALADELTDQPIVLRCHPDSAPRLEGMLSGQQLPADTVRIVPAADCGPLEVHVKAPGAEILLDQERVIARIRQAIGEFFDATPGKARKEPANG